MNLVKINALSLFSGAGIAEFGFKNTKVKIILSNELIPIRNKVHEYWHPNTKTICGDITDENIKNKIINESIKKKIDFIFATPPCQGISLIGKNKSNDQMIADKRNYLIFDTFEIIDKLKPSFVLIENVSRFFKIKFIINNELLGIKEIIINKYKKEYNIEFDIFNAKNFGVPQHRERAIIRMWKKKFRWIDPKSEKIITVWDSISNLPSLESGQKSNIKNHNARNHIASHIEIMKHTPTGKSAFDNKFYYPKNKKTGEKLKGYMATYKRINWNKPSPTITMRNDCISSQSNVHPGRLLSDGTYSDARVLTLRELFILSSLDPNLNVPKFVSDIQIRNMIGESVPPLLINKILKGIKYNDK
ncbi:Modification methylase [Candidatus Hepatoplasma crinochetorum Av]|uniref:Cytosine-specific methyltransferase n=1 Tax=Candidatus Hepatoplasma crinochetorum Av TaxID=1427984 RepID=W8GFT9_9MOLU|nr:DNA cytosine methyltransferase [Candidatus Hepatoplasma crinochetorum]AHK22649.1 Modification methylase [Candidatus Hepatoplasma crinochetorum Av]